MPDFVDSMRKNLYNEAYGIQMPEAVVKTCILWKGLGLFIWKTERDWEADWDLSCFRQDVQSDAEMCGNFPGCAGRTEAAALC